jgi:hypothetical protein
VSAQLQTLIEIGTEKNTTIVHRARRQRDANGRRVPTRYEQDAKSVFRDFLRHWRRLAEPIRLGNARGIPGTRRVVVCATDVSRTEQHARRSDAYHCR